MGGGGGQEVKNTGEYPAEFKPLATKAAAQIGQMQQALPLAGFAAPNPGQTAGIAPFQQAAMNMAPQLLAPSWGLQTLQQMGQPVNQLANNAIGVGNQTSPFTNAMSALASGGFGTGNPSFPGAQPQTPFQMQQPGMPAIAPQANVVGGSPDQMAQLTSQLSRPIPPSTPILPGAVTGPVPPTSTQAAQQSIPPHFIDQLTQLLQTYTPPPSYSGGGSLRQER